MQSKTLDEISFIRPILIFLLVYYHAFCIFDGGWTPILGLEDVIIYKWTDKLAYSFMLETFFFISGYLFSFQFFELKKESNILSIIQKKFSRLLLPCWIFGIVYAALFEQFDSFFSQTIKIASGIGHLWFLPMLFWCFVFGSICLKKQSVSISLLLVFLLLSLFANNPLPLQLNQCMKYFFFFYLGMYLYPNKERIKKTKFSINIILLWLLFVVLFVAGTFLNEYLTYIKDGSNSFIFRQFIIMIKYAVRLTYATTGVLCIYLTSLYFTEGKKLHNRYIEFGTYCFGIYIFQQFILNNSSVKL